VECVRILIVEVLDAMGPWRRWWLCMKRARVSVTSVERKRGSKNRIEVEVNERMWGVVAARIE
jgi:hypothetical protein